MYLQSDVHLKAHVCTHTHTHTCPHTHSYTQKKLRRDAFAVKKIGFFSRGPEFKYQHHAGSQPPMPSVPKDTIPSSDFLGDLSHTGYMQAKFSYKPKNNFLKKGRGRIIGRVMGKMQWYV